jgi:hypothetical protein
VIGEENEHRETLSLSLAVLKISKLYIKLDVKCVKVESAKRKRKMMPVVIIIIIITPTQRTTHVTFFQKKIETFLL